MVFTEEGRGCLGGILAIIFGIGIITIIGGFIIYGIIILIAS